MFKKIAHYFVRKEYCRKAIDEQADLSTFKEKLSRPIYTGLFLIALSYTMGLPTVIAFSAVAASMNQPVIGVVGGALMYGISHLMFFIGVTMAGKKYVVAMNRWLTRIILEKILGSEVKTSRALPQEESISEQLKN
ncbi:MAG: hypothetical protein ABFD57_06680 [Smithella sp.]|nr:hypothetical protein [Syntrophaceae bacterium]